MKKKLFWQFSGLVVSVGMVLVSLVMAQNVSSGGVQIDSQKPISAQSHFLPGHAFYPFLVVIDRVQLALASPTQRIMIMTAYSQRRLESAQQLFMQGKSDLALTTLLKAHYYLLQAADLTVEKKQIKQVSSLLLALDSFFAANNQLKASTNVADKTTFAIIAAQNRSVRSRLQTWLYTEH